MKENKNLDEFKKITNEMAELYERKNHDYGDSFSETFKKLGIISAVTRITDKNNRLQSLATNEQRVNDESIEDTLIDLASYSVMTLIELRKNNNATISPLDVSVLAVNRPNFVSKGELTND